MLPVTSPLFSRRGLLAGAAFFFCLAGVGCVKEQLVHAPEKSQLFVNGQLQKDVAIKADEPFVTSDEPRAPKSTTCVAYADFLRSRGEFLMDKSRKTEEEAKRRGLVSEATGYFGLARQRYRQALQLDANDHGAQLGLARLAVAEGNYPAALQGYEQLLKVDNRHPVLWMEIGNVYAKAKNWDAAIAALQKANELQPNHPAITSNLGWTLARAERFEEAWQVFRPQVGEAQAYFRLAQMSLHLGKADLARTYLTYSLQRDPALTDARELLANLDRRPAETGMAPDPQVQPAAVQPPQ